MMLHYDKVTVALGDRSYEVRIAQGLVDTAGEHVAPLLSRARVAVISDETVAALHFDRLHQAFTQMGIKVDHLSLPAGEATKSWPHLMRCTEWLIDRKIERGDMVVALGGGVIGDLVGFSAAILRRGVRFVQIPTSLLAQVDSSVGGKTGINSAHGKNLIGAFHQPSLVLADVDVTDTLGPRDFWAGYGEVVKYALLGDEGFFDWLEQHAAGLRHDKAARHHALMRCVQMKADIVARDETEQGDRALLNLGHTFGHALEKATGYGTRLLHGEGVTIGCALAFDLSARLGLCSQETPVRVRAHFKGLGLKTDLHDIEGGLPDADGLMGLMAQDKKVQDGKARFILARGIGHSFVADDVPQAMVRDLLTTALMG